MEIKIHAIESLLSDSPRTKWYPIPVETFRRSINLDAKYTPALKSNFAYSMQYLEYLERQIQELKLSAVLLIMSYKTYIIVSMGIIEGLFSNLLQRTGQWNMTTWQEYGRITSNPKFINEENTKSEIILYHESDQIPMRMDLDSMIKKIEHKGLLSIDHSTFPALKNLRRLRNQVHLQNGDSPTEHDYNKFSSEEFFLMRKILYSILICKEFCLNKNAFSFLKQELFTVTETGEHILS